MSPLARSFSPRPAGHDGISRSVCDHCNHVIYDNPKIIVGAVVLHDDKVLLCRRAIEPRKNYWTIPAGYMELGETPEQGAMREAREEANADVILSGLLAVYTVRRQSQVQLIYHARLAAAEFSPGAESLEVKLFSFDTLPWDEIAFPTVHWMLADIQKVIWGWAALPFGNPAGAPEPDI